MISISDNVCWRMLSIAVGRYAARLNVGMITLTIGFDGITPSNLLFHPGNVGQIAYELPVRELSMAVAEPTERRAYGKNAPAARRTVTLIKAGGQHYAYTD